MEVFIGLLVFFGPYVLAFVLYRRKRLLEAKLRDADSALVKMAVRNAEMEAKLQPIEDAERYTRMLVINAEDKVAELMAELEKSSLEINEKISKDKELSAFLERTVQAMKNAIEGYSDEYIIPNHSVLDDLAESYSHKQAGEQLKIARKNVRHLIQSNQAGNCDYSSSYRRQFAIHFVVDAFNGKVDSALSRVKSDNYGKIKQEIIDAFTLVNHNGMSFRGARIEQAYLDARLEELKWAVATYELQQQEREEQRQIREQMREEERAQREMEKAIKEAEKEERMLQKALDKARQELAGANDEQRQLFEAQLAELEAKLQEAEARGQRAISMAQQTRRGHVYVISNIGSFGENVFKVGMTRRLEPLDRVKELSDASVPFDFDVHAMIYSDDAPSLEKDLHRVFDENSVNKVNPRKEFFRLPLADIKKAIEGHGLSDIHWTMKAEATEYRESLSLLKKEQTVRELVEA
ncbi:DUF4041 domain-containing protein [Aeromonas allosaccharophila]|jgi:hypothetical protein|uniref:DUF4041 domain-containing protein n=1 Tax=Aeromonas TaxID=642 RepID=UPI00341A25CD